MGLNTLAWERFSCVNQAQSETDLILDVSPAKRRDCSTVNFSRCIAVGGGAHMESRKTLRSRNAQGDSHWSIITIAHRLSKNYLLSERSNLTSVLPVQRTSTRSFLKNTHSIALILISQWKQHDLILGKIRIIYLCAQYDSYLNSINRLIVVIGTCFILRQKTAKPRKLLTKWRCFCYHKSSITSLLNFINYLVHLLSSLTFFLLQRFKTMKSTKNLLCRFNEENLFQQINFKLIQSLMKLTKYYDTNLEY